MKIKLLLFILCICNVCHGQYDEKLSTMDFVQILDNNKEETIFYYQNNWKILREMALKKNYISSYQLLEVQTSEEQPFQLILMTTYSNKDQFELKEIHFDELIKEKGELRLLNDKEPKDFRKILFNKERVKHYK